ncbi:UdgX family uracil-DNA binding protein [Jannaschia sp. W003]|uniref:UdgX family uracil-DNA binding protein n=1 Tax=Jannaschia sp. W003 TaxID=2867012 RepID=UPI0021A5ECE2|nr:UdgX family uracil-DNA binding protein [Jannaschia sp. W003]UWQ21313.1 UdgX family uracil-DNA binding protein [Jannaschia sp. W003]
MHAPRLPRIGTLAAWRDTARRLAAAHADPANVDWGLETDGAPALFDEDLPAPSRSLRVPKAFAELVRTLVPERTGEGMALAYALLVRLQETPGLLGNRADPQVARAEAIAKEIRRDLHKMHAFVRFREVPAPEGAAEGARRRFAAWFEPDHRIEEECAPFFAARFGDMDWRIATPEVLTIFEGGELRLVPHVGLRPDAEDPLEQLWTTYYGSIFNPARLKPDAMRAEMPRKYWRNLPEARAIPDLIAGARARVAAMKDAAPTPARPRPRPAKEAPPMPDPHDDLFAAAGGAPGGSRSLAELAEAAHDCTRCPLHADATQVVFGEGPAEARVMFVGEQPGDREDIAGRPFVGPAGKLFTEQAEAAGLDRSDYYVTNAVKHFKFVQRGKRRIHQKPAASEVSACNWWLRQELAQVDPQLCVAMGATALHALTGSGAGILKRRGAVEQTKDGRPVLVTVHPSYLLRLPDADLREAETAKFRADLARVRELLEERAA